MRFRKRTKVLNIPYILEGKEEKYMGKMHKKNTVLRTLSFSGKAFIVFTKHSLKSTKQSVHEKTSNLLQYKEKNLIKMEEMKNEKKCVRTVFLSVALGNFDSYDHSLYVSSLGPSDSAWRVSFDPIWDLSCIGLLHPTA